MTIVNSLGVRSHSLPTRSVIVKEVEVILGPRTAPALTESMTYKVNLISASVACAVIIGNIIYLIL